MPFYDVYCKKCDIAFETFCSHDNLKKTKCNKCNSKVERLWTLTGQLGDKNENFGYMAKKNYERATGERRTAEAALKKGEKRPYRPINDGNRMNYID